MAWIHGRVEIGAGRILGHSPLLSWKDPDFDSVSYVTISTADETEGHWWVDQDLCKLISYVAPASNCIQVHVWLLSLSFTVESTLINQAGKWPTEFTYITTIGYSSMIFYVQACRDVYVILTEIPENPRTRSLELAVGIGNNLRIELRKGVGGPVLESVSHEGVLNCFEKRAFWLSFQHPRIILGSGEEIDKNILVSHIDEDDLNINSLGVSASPDVDAKWEFPYFTGQSFRKFWLYMY